MHQELDVAGGAGQGGNHRPHDAGSGVLEGRTSPLRGPAPDLGVPDHALAPGHDGPAGLELRLDQEDQFGVGRGRAGPQSAGTTVTREMKERSAVMQRARARSRVAPAAAVSGVSERTLTRSSTVTRLVVAQALVQLAVADVDGVDLGRPPLEEAVGEPPGGRSGIEGAPALGDRRRTGSGRRRASAPPRLTNGAGRPQHDDGLVGRHQAGRLVGLGAGHQHLPGGDGRLGLVPVGDQAAPDELGIEPPAGPVLSCSIRGVRLLGGGLLGGGAFLAAAFLAGAFLAAAFLAAVPSWPSAAFLAGAFFARPAASSAARRRLLGRVVAVVSWRAFLARPSWPRPGRLGALRWPHVGVALRPASAERLRMSATWLASVSSDEESILLSWADTSWRTRSRICSLVLRLRSTKLSTHSCACPRWMSPALTSSLTISSARARVTWPNTVPASRYFLIRSLLAMIQEYLTC